MSDYPPDWQQIANVTKADADWRCIRCDHENSYATGHVLTVHHLDLDKANCKWWNLVALCQRCHLSIQARVVIERPWMFEHTEWFRPYAAGFYASTVLGEELTRAQVEERLDELLDLGRVA